MDEARKLLAIEGPNGLERQGNRSAFAIALEVLREPMFLFLVLAGGIYVALGETSEAIVLCLFATTSVAIVIVQEFRSERVLQALKDLASPRALVIRDGESRRIAGRDEALASQAAPSTQWMWLSSISSRQILAALSRETGISWSTHMA